MDYYNHPTNEVVPESVHNEITEMVAEANKADQPTEKDNTTRNAFLAIGAIAVVHAVLEYIVFA